MAEQAPPDSASHASGDGGFSHELSAWLTRLEEAQVHKLPDPPTLRPKRKPNSKFLAYCIEPHFLSPTDKVYQLVLRAANRLKDGDIRANRELPMLNPHRPASYMSNEDVTLINRYLKLSQGTPGAAMLRGGGWEPMIEVALHLERLLFCKQANAGDPNPKFSLMDKGTPCTVRATWKNLPDGNFRPILDLGDSKLILLPTLPPLCIDPATSSISHLESDLSPTLLTTWAAGPIIPANEAAKLSKHFADHAEFSDLDGPIQLVIEELPATPPRPSLRILSTKVGKYRHFETLLATLTFQYGDSPPLIPISADDPITSIWIRDGKYHSVKRDRKAENKLAKQLANYSLAPLRKTIPTTRLSPELVHAILAKIPKLSEKEGWLHFLANHADQLRADGWTIEIDRSAGFIIHEVDELFPSIERESGEKIDWFRFELSGKVNGKQINLLPYIANAINDGLLDIPAGEIPMSFLICGSKPEDGYIRFPGPRLIEICRNVAHLFLEAGHLPADTLRIDRLNAADLANSLRIDDSETSQALASLGSRLRDIGGLPEINPSTRLKATLRPYQLAGFRWLRFLWENQLHGILADDMGLGKTIQTLAHLVTKLPKRSENLPSLVIAPTSVISNWAAEIKRFTPKLKVLLLHGSDRAEHFGEIRKVDLVLTSYPLLVRDQEILLDQHWHILVLDEAQYIKNPKTGAAQAACRLIAEHRLCLSGTPMENHLGELWSLMHFLMPGLLPNEAKFTRNIRRPIERDHNAEVQLALNRRIAPLILRRTKDEVAPDLPPKTHILHNISFSPDEADLYESVRALMDKRVRQALVDRGMSRSHIVVLDALLKLRQLCCHPSLLKTPAAEQVKEGSKLNYLTEELLPTLFEEKRRILLFSQFTSVLKLIETRLKASSIPYLKLTGQTKKRGELVEKFQTGEFPIFLISLKAGGTGLNLTAADTIIHYDPWWNPAAENQATDRAHRIGQTKPVFVHKLICAGTIEDHILALQKKKSDLVDALLTKETTKLRLDSETLAHLLSPLK